MDNSKTLQRLPIGIQDFTTIRKRDYLYVDKTDLLYEMAQEYFTYFLSRPRRFGKSLILSTLQAYFEGRKELFKGLAIERLEQKWEQYPVIRLDLSLCSSGSRDELNDSLRDILCDQFVAHGMEITNPKASATRLFGELIQGLYHKTGKEVVILVDEYDKGLISVLRDSEELEKASKLLSDFYINIKSMGGMIRFAMLTGVARFRHVTIFSGLNNLRDISMDTRYASICGFTHEELVDYFHPYIENVGKSQSWDIDTTMSNLLQRYDGYRFTKADVKVVNPFSLLNCFMDNDLGDYWISTGTSRVLVEYLKANDYTLAQLDGAVVSQSTLSDLYQDNNPIPLFYQTGYLTIKDIVGERYELGFPNGEVQRALICDLMPQFMGMKRSEMEDNVIDMKSAFSEGNVEQIIACMRSIISSVPYHLWPEKTVEASFHMLVHVICMVAGISTQSEMSQSKVRVDMVCQMLKRVYVFEFKLDGTLQEAMAQIDSKGYALRWNADGREVYKIGVVFSSKSRNISEWAVEAGAGIIW